MRLRHISSAVKLLAFAAVLQAVVGFCYALTRIYTLRAASLDIGAYEQLLGNILATGKPLATLHTLGGEINWMGFHFTPILYLIAPLYALAPGPAILCGLHSLVIALAVIPVYMAARALGLKDWQATIAGMAYLFNPFTLNGSIWGFQEPGLAALWMAIAVWALAAKRFGWLCAASFLLLITKEHFGLSVIALGGLWWWMHGDRRGLMLSLAGALAFLLIMLVIMPYFRGNYLHPMLMAHSASDRFSWLFSREGREGLGKFMVIVDVKYIFIMLVCFCLLPIAGFPWLLAGAADFGVIMLSSLSFYRSPYGCYSLAVIPIVTVAACAGYMKLQPYMQDVRGRKILYGCLGINALAFYAYLACLPLPFSVNLFEFAPAPQLALTQGDAQAVHDIKALLPPQPILGVQDNIGMFFPEYRQRYTFIAMTQPADDLILWIGLSRLYSPMGATVSDVNQYIMKVDALLRNDRLKIIYWHQPWLVMSGHGEEAPGAREEAKAALEAVAAEQELLLRVIMQP